VKKRYRVNTAFALPAAGLSNSFVPAAALAYRRGLRMRIGGLCETDYSGHPDCRNDTLLALAKAISLGLAFPFPFPIERRCWGSIRRRPGAWRQSWAGHHAWTSLLSTRTRAIERTAGRATPWGYGCDSRPAGGLRARAWEK